MKSFVCRILGHKWLDWTKTTDYDFNRLRVCRRCAVGERGYEVIIPARSQNFGPVAVNWMGRKFIVREDGTEA